MFKDNVIRKNLTFTVIWVILCSAGLVVNYYFETAGAAESPADVPAISLDLAVNSLPAEITGAATTIRIDWSDSRTLVNNPLTGEIEPASEIQKQMQQYLELKKKVHDANSLWYYFLTYNFFESGGGK